MRLRCRSPSGAADVGSCDGGISAHDVPTLGSDGGGGIVVPCSSDVVGALGDILHRSFGSKIFNLTKGRGNEEGGKIESYARGYWDGDNILEGRHICLVSLQCKHSSSSSSSVGASFFDTERVPAWPAQQEPNFPALYILQPYLTAYAFSLPLPYLVAALVQAIQ